MCRSREIIHIQQIRIQIFTFDGKTAYVCNKNFKMHRKNQEEGKMNKNSLNYDIFGVNLSKILNKHFSSEFDSIMQWKCTRRQ